MQLLCWRKNKQRPRKGEGISPLKMVSTVGRIAGRAAVSIGSVVGETFDQLDLLLVFHTVAKRDVTQPGTCCV